MRALSSPGEAWSWPRLINAVPSEPEPGLSPGPASFCRRSDRGRLCLRFTVAPAPCDPRHQINISTALRLPGDDPWGAWAPGPDRASAVAGTFERGGLLSANIQRKAGGHREARPERSAARGLSWARLRAPHAGSCGRLKRGVADSHAASVLRLPGCVVAGEGRLGSVLKIVRAFDLVKDRWNSLRLSWRFSLFVPFQNRPTVFRYLGP